MYPYTYPLLSKPYRFKEKLFKNILMDKDVSNVQIYFMLLL